MGWRAAATEAWKPCNGMVVLIYLCLCKCFMKAGCDGIYHLSTYI